MDVRNIEEIFEKIQDEESRDIFANRLLYSMTGNRRFMRDIVLNTKEGKELDSRIKSFKKYILFGAGTWGKNIIWLYSDINWLFVWDNNPRKDHLRGEGKGFSRDNYCLPIKKYNSNYKIDIETCIIISSRLYHAEIFEKLISDGISEYQIIDAGELVDEMSKRQYFDLPYMKKNRDEVFVDAGAFDGQTSVYFDYYYHGDYNKIFAFEPDVFNIEKIKKRMIDSSCHDVKVVPFGLWDKRCQLSFSANGTGTSMVDENGKTTINVDKMDNLIHDDEIVSFIKMDLEGAEYKALLGAERIIRSNRPKLAISLYHNPSDVWEIPKLILDFNSDYNLYLRHYSIAASETVLYAL